MVGEKSGRGEEGLDALIVGLEVMREVTYIDVGIPLG